jgi:nitrite reductase (NADH) large subunit
VNTLSQLKERTRAQHELRQLHAAVPGPAARRRSREFEEEVKKVLCACVPFAEDKLREILRSQRLRSVQDVLEIYGNGKGCEVCKAGA